MLLSICLLVFCLGLASGGTSCAGRCREAYNPSSSCQCGDRCNHFENCCSDYENLCNLDSGTCKGRCNSPFDSRQPCQCFTGCENYNECCSDYSTECPASPGRCTPISISSSEIRKVSLEFFDLDVNGATSYDIRINEQTQTTYDSRTDVAPEKFFTFVSSKLTTKPTYTALINLLDNYKKRRGQAEIETPQERAEQIAFIDEFMKTYVGKRLYTFLSSKGRAGCGDENAFKQKLRLIWFGLFRRTGNGAPDSCGFEHVFVGELTSREVTGFHNWIQFYRQENTRHVNYYGYINAKSPYMYTMHFTWDRYMKKQSGMVMGSSPEYDLAIFTLCHLARPSKSCRVQLREYDGSVVKRIIKAYPWQSDNAANGWKYVSTSYFAVY